MVVDYYGYLWLTIRDGREQVLSGRGHKLVTISEIAWNNDRVLEITRTDIILLL
jgi:hypothetical protein